MLIIHNVIFVHFLDSIFAQIQNYIILWGILGEKADTFFVVISCTLNCILPALTLFITYNLKITFDVFLLTSFLKKGYLAIK